MCIYIYVHGASARCAAALAVELASSLANCATRIPPPIRMLSTLSSPLKNTSYIRQLTCVYIYIYIFMTKQTIDMCIFIAYMQCCIHMAVSIWFPCPMWTPSVGPYEAPYVAPYGAASGAQYGASYGATCELQWSFTWSRI